MRLCCVDLRITPSNEIVQLSLVPYNFEGAVFDTFIKPSDPKSIFGSGYAGGPKFYGVQDIIEKGVEDVEALDLLDRWFVVCGSEKVKIIGFDWVFKSYFLTELLGHEMYYMFFEHSYRDLKSIAEFLNERQKFYKKELLNVTHLCTHLDIRYERSHDTLYLCGLMKECYRKLLYKAII